MNLPEIISFTIAVQETQAIEAMVQTNQVSQKHGLSLTSSDALEIYAARNRSICDHNRVELGMDAVLTLITSFCSSPYINQAEYTATLKELVDVFYYMKTLTEDKIGDDELINLMQAMFNNSCHGSLELLKNRELILMASLISRFGL